MAQHTLEIFQCLHRKIFKVRLDIFQHYEWKGWCYDWFTETLFTNTLELAWLSCITYFKKFSSTIVASKLSEFTGKYFRDSRSKDKTHETYQNLILHFSIFFNVYHVLSSYTLCIKKKCLFQNMQ